MLLGIMSTDLHTQHDQRVKAGRHTKILWLVLKTVPLGLRKHGCVHAHVCKFYFKFPRFVFACDRNTISTAF